MFSCARTAGGNTATTDAASTALIQPRRNSTPICKLASLVILSVCRRPPPARSFCFLSGFSRRPPPAHWSPNTNLTSLCFFAPISRSLAPAPAATTPRNARCRVRPERCIRRARSSTASTRRPSQNPICGRRLAEIGGRHEARILVGDVAGLAQQQRQRADRRGQRDFSPSVALTSSVTALTTEGLSAFSSAS